MVKAARMGMALLLAWMVSSLGLRAQGIQFVDGSWEDALAMAAKRRCMVMMVVCTPDLDACTIMEEEVFADPEVGAAVNAHFVAWRLDATGLAEHPFFEGIRMLSIPEFVFCDAQGRPQYRASRYHDRDQLLALIAAAQIPENHLTQRHRAYLAGQREPAFVRRYIVEMDALGEDMQGPSREYAHTLQGPELLLTENWTVARIGLAGVLEPSFQYVVAHRDSFEQAYGAAAWNEFVLQVYDRSLRQAVEGQEGALLAACQGLVLDLLGPEAGPPVALQNELQFQAAGGDWEDYWATAQDLLGSYTLEEASVYNDVAWNICQHRSDTAAWQQAATWATRSISLEPAYWNYHTLATLQYKLGDKAAALRNARNANRFVKPGTPEAQEVDALLQMIQK